MEFIAGVKFERTTLRMSSQDTYSHLLVLFIPGAGVILTNFAHSVDLGGDLQVNLTIPYVGITLNGGAYRSTFRIGLAGATVTAPLRLSDDGIYQISALFVAAKQNRLDISEEARYTFANAGLYLDGSFEYDFDLAGALGLTCWVQGTWMSIPGGGNVDLTGKSRGGIFPIFAPPFIFPADFYGASGSGRPSGLSEYSLNIGIKGILTF